MSELDALHGTDSIPTTNNYKNLIIQSLVIHINAPSGIAAKPENAHPLPRSFGWKEYDDGSTTDELTIIKQLTISHRTTIFVKLQILDKKFSDGKHTIHLYCKGSPHLKDWWLKFRAKSIEVTRLHLITHPLASEPQTEYKSKNLKVTLESTSDFRIGEVTFGGLKPRKSPVRDAGNFTILCVKNFSPNRPVISESAFALPGTMEASYLNPQAEVWPNPAVTSRRGVLPSYLMPNGNHLTTANPEEHLELTSNSTSEAPANYGSVAEPALAPPVHKNAFEVQPNYRTPVPSRRYHRSSSEPNSTANSRPTIRADFWGEEYAEKHFFDREDPLRGLPLRLPTTQAVAPPLRQFPALSNDEIGPESFQEDVLPPRESSFSASPSLHWPPQPDDDNYNNDPRASPTPDNIQSNPQDAEQNLPISKVKHAKVAEGIGGHFTGLLSGTQDSSMVKVKVEQGPLVESTLTYAGKHKHSEGNSKVTQQSPRDDVLHRPKTKRNVPTWSDSRSTKAMNLGSNPKIDPASPVPNIHTTPPPSSFPLPAQESHSAPRNRPRVDKSGLKAIILHIRSKE